jgi:hypothetical protein
MEDRQMENKAYQNATGVRSARARGKGLLSRLAVAMLLVLSIGSGAWALPLLPLQVSSNPGNGDANPYGVLYVPVGFLTTTVQPGNILVSNFNDGAGNQGQGTTIINIRQDRSSALFAKVPTPGLTAAMGILKAGFVLIGSITVPKPSMFTGAVGGPITVFDANGKLVTTITSSTFLDGPWGMAVEDNITTAKVFVSNVLNGTVTRINLTLSPSFHVDSITKIVQGLGHINTMTNPLIGPSGLAFSEQKHILYVTSAAGFSVFAVPNADTATAPVPFSSLVLVYSDVVHLHGPLGLVLAPNGDLISAQNDGINVNPAKHSEIVEFTPVPSAKPLVGPAGLFVTQFSIDAANGAAFNIAINQNSDPLVPPQFAYVNDNENNLVQLYLPTWQFGFGNILFNHQ